MKQPKRTFCKIYLPRLSYSKTTLQLSPYCPTTYSLPQHHLLPYHLLPYYLLPYYLLLTTAPLTSLSLTTLLLGTLLLTPYHSTTYNLITYYLLPYFLPLTTLLLTTLLPTPLQHIPLFFDTQPRFATHKWGINPKFIITLPCTSVHERSVYLGFASHRYHTPLNFRPAPHIVFGGLTKHKGKYNLAKSSKRGTSSNGRTNKPYNLKAKEKR